MNNPGVVFVIYGIIINTGKYIIYYSFDFKMGHLIVPITYLVIKSINLYFLPSIQYNKRNLISTL